MVSSGARCCCCYGALAAVILLTVLRMGILTTGVAGAADTSDLRRISPFSSESLWLVRQAKAIIETYQVDAEATPVAEERLVHGAIKGMVESWKDPYTRFVSP